MPATLARVALITQEFRWDLQVSVPVAGKRLRARAMEEPSYCSTAAGAATVNAAIFALLSGDPQLIEVPVNPIPDFTFDRLAPIAQLTYEPLGLVRDCIIVGVRKEVRADGGQKGTLLLW